MPHQHHVSFVTPSTPSPIAHTSSPLANPQVAHSLSLAPTPVHSTAPLSAPSTHHSTPTTDIKHDGYNEYVQTDSGGLIHRDLLEGSSSRAGISSRAGNSSRAETSSRADESASLDSLLDHEPVLLVSSYLVQPHCAAQLGLVGVTALFSHAAHHFPGFYPRFVAAPFDPGTTTVSSCASAPVLCLQIAFSLLTFEGLAFGIMNPVALKRSAPLFL